MRPDGTIDMEKPRIFYDPLGRDNPALAMMNDIPVPIEIERVAAEVNGQELSLRQVFDRLLPLCMWVTAWHDCITVLTGVPAKYLVERWLNKAQEASGNVGAVYTRAGVLPLDSVDARVIAEQLKRFGDKKILTRIFVTKFRPPVLV